MHKCKRTCYWVLEVLVCIAIWTTTFESLSVWWYTMQYVVFMSNKKGWFFLWISIPFVCKGSGTYGTEVMQNFFLCMFSNSEILGVIFKLKKCPFSPSLTALFFSSQEIPLSSFLYSIYISSSFLHVLLICSAYLCFSLLLALVAFLSCDSWSNHFCACLLRLIFEGILLLWFSGLPRIPPSIDVLAFTMLALFCLKISYRNFPSDKLDLLIWSLCCVISMWKIVTMGICFLAVSPADHAHSFFLC